MSILGICRSTVLLSSTATVFLYSFGTELRYSFGNNSVAVLIRNIVLQLCCCTHLVPTALLSICIYKCTSTATLCCCNTMMLQHYDAATLCCCNTMLLQDYVAATLCCCKTMLLQHYVAATLCCCNTIMLYSLGRVLLHSLSTNSVAVDLHLRMICCRCVFVDRSASTDDRRL